MNPGFGIKMNILNLFWSAPPVSSVFEFYLPVSTKGEIELLMSTKFLNRMIICYQLNPVL